MFVKVGSGQARQTQNAVSVVEQTRLDQLDLVSNEFRASVAPLFTGCFSAFKISSTKTEAHDSMAARTRRHVSQ